MTLSEVYKPTKVTLSGIVYVKMENGQVIKYTHFPDKTEMKRLLNKFLKAYNGFYVSVIFDNDF